MDYYKYKKYKQKFKQIAAGINERESRNYIDNVLLSKNKIPMTNLGIINRVPDTEIAYNSLYESIEKRNFKYLVNTIVSKLDINLPKSFLLIGFQLNVNAKMYNRDGSVTPWNWSGNSEKHAIVIDLVKKNGGYTLEFFDSNGSTNPDKYYFDRTIHYLIHGIKQVLVDRDNISIDIIETRFESPSLHYLTAGGGDCDALAIFYIFLRNDYSLFNVNKIFEYFEGDNSQEENKVKKQRKIINMINYSIKHSKSLEIVVKFIENQTGVIIPKELVKTQVPRTRMLEITPTSSQRRNRTLIGLQTVTSEQKAKKRIKRIKRKTGPRSWKLEYGIDFN